MKAKYLIIVSIILAVLTIGAVSASEDAITDDGLAASDVAEDPIEEVAADEAIVESTDSEPALEVGSSDFNVNIKDSVDLSDENAVAINYTAPVGADGYVYVYLDENEYSSYYKDLEEVTVAENINISLDDLGIYQTGTYNVTVKYIPLPYEEGNDVILANAKMNVVKTYTKEDDFGIWFNDEAYNKDSYVASLGYVPEKGTFIVSVNGYPRFTRNVDSESFEEESLHVYLSDLGITTNGQYTISAKYIVNSTAQEVDLGQKTLDVEVEWTSDEYVSVSSSVDILRHDDYLVFVSDYGDYLNGTLTVYIDNSLKFTKKVAASEKKDDIAVTVDDLGIYNSALGKHTVKAVYMKNNAEKHEAEKSVQYTAEPSFESYYTISVGEKEALVITYIKGFTGTATLYNAVRDPEYYYEFVKGTVFKSANFVNGVATIPFDSLAKGDHVFLLNITGMEYERQIYVDVRENTPGITASVSASEILVGNNVVVKFNGPKSEEKVYITLDGKDYKSAVLNTGALSETITGLTVGTHKIGIKFYDDDKFYSNTFYVTVKQAAAKKADKVTLTLKKVKVKKSAKKLVIQATLKINGKAVKGKVIKFKFNKKSYKAKTNKKGVAKITVKKAVLKKLKVGKKVKYQATYGKVTKKVTVKVKK